MDKETSGVTIFPNNHPAHHYGYYRLDQDGLQSAEEIFRGAAPSEFQKSKEVLVSSFPDLGNGPITKASTNGFVKSAIHAYSCHHHLIIRPEDVWFAIITQLGFYVNRHAEAFGSDFVAHEGNIALNVYGAGILYAGHREHLTTMFADEIQAHVKKPELRDWIMPDFTTTTESDKVVAPILMMGSMQSYFEYYAAHLGGLPSVTLLGDRTDWEKIFDRIQKLPELSSVPELNEELTRWYALLKPILSFFVRSFEDPENKEVIDFWNRIAREDSMRSGWDVLSGWITAFCFWNKDGERKFDNPLLQKVDDIQISPELTFDLAVALKNQMSIDTIPAGYCTVPLTVNENGTVHYTRMIAGSMGVQVTSSGRELDNVCNSRFPEPPSDKSDLDSLQPISGWLLYTEQDKDGEEEWDKNE